MLVGIQPNFQLRAGGGTEGEEISAATTRIEKLRKLRERVSESWRQASDSQAKNFDKRHKEMIFKRKDLVSLSIKTLKLKGVTKLAPCYIGPFRVLNAIGSQAYRLALPIKYARTIMSLRYPYSSLGMKGIQKKPTIYQCQNWKKKMMNGKLKKYATILISMISCNVIK
jgi:hypothetical protein